MKSLLLLFCFFIFISSALAATRPPQCGTYGAAYFVNVGTSFEVTAIYATPMSVLTNHPYLFGCTPKSVTGPNNVTATFEYYKPLNSVFVENATYSYLGLPYNNVQNTFIPYTNVYPLAISTSSISGKNFPEASMAMKYAGSNNNLKSIKSTAGSAMAMYLKKMFPFLNMDQSESIDIYLDYKNPSYPYHASNITVSENGNVLVTASLTFFNFSSGRISKIYYQDSISGYENTFDFLYTSPNGYGQMISECTQYKKYCLDYSYDSFGRVYKIASNNETDVLLTYIPIANGLWQINTVQDSIGLYTFH